MRFKNIDDLIACPPDNIRSYLKDCKVFEKINTHYVKIHIISPDNIICCKANGDRVTQIDIILNGMWRHFIEDWSYIKNNPGFRLFAKHYKGCIFGMYYFPNHNPLGTEYSFPTERCYLMNQCYDTYSHAELSISIVYKFLKKCMGVMVTDMDKRYTLIPVEELKFDDSRLDNLLDSDEVLTGSGIVNCLYDDDEQPIMSKDRCLDNLAVVLKSGHRCYEILPETTTDSCKVADYKERSSYEFVLCDFVKFFNERNMIGKLRGTYRNIVCYLFNEYITSWEKPSGYIKHNVNPEFIMPPHVGYDHKDSIIPAYVPNTLTRKLCDENLLYRNIFKLLLANLKTMKSPKYCVYMNNEQIGALNTIVQAILIIQTDKEITANCKKSKKNQKAL